MQILFLEQPADSKVRVLVCPVNEGASPAGVEPVVVRAAQEARFTGKSGQIFETFVERGDDLARVVLVGLGEPGAAGRMSAIEKAGAKIVAKFHTSGEETLRLDVANATLSAAEIVAFLLGARLRSWRIDTYHTRLADDKKPTLVAIEVSGAPADIGEAWAKADALAQGVEFTRGLVSEPANVLYPETFVERCKERYQSTGLKLRVLGPDDMAALGMNALLGVAQGSVRPPRLLAIEWPGGDSGKAPALFIGKGVTFDSGGISIKPAAGMEEMKWDMGGAGAVAGVMLALALRKAKANVVGICTLAENMPDGGAQRPGDIVQSMSGQTIEVINTDAEGRLVLCDALTWGQKEYQPATIIDLATLTGAMIVSLAHEYAGLFANDEALAASLIAAGRDSGDEVWRFPLGPAYDKMLDSQIADMRNVGPRFGGSITAAQFLKRFIEKDTPWAHLDIAGMVWSDKPGATWDKGATGYGVRLLDRYVRSALEG